MLQAIARELSALNDDSLLLVASLVHSLASRPHNCVSATPHPALRVIHRSPPLKSLAFLERPDGAHFVCSSGGMVTYISPALADWIGVPAEALHGDGWMKYVDGHDERKRIAEVWMLAAQTKQAFSYTVRCRSASGVIAYTFVRVRPIYETSADAPLRFFGTAHAQIIPASLQQLTAHTA